MGSLDNAVVKAFVILSILFVSDVIFANGITDYGTVEFSISSRFYEYVKSNEIGHGSTFVLKKCERESDCSTVFKDIRDIDIHFSTSTIGKNCREKKCDTKNGFQVEFKLRPGSYQISLMNQNASMNFNFDLENREVIQIPFAEIYFSNHEPGVFHASGYGLGQKTFMEDRRLRINRLVSLFGLDQYFYPIRLQSQWHPIKDLNRVKELFIPIFFETICSYVRQEKHLLPVAHQTCLKINRKGFVARDDADQIIFGDYSTDVFSQSYLSLESLNSQAYLYFFHLNRSEADMQFRLEELEKFNSVIDSLLFEADSLPRTKKSSVNCLVALEDKITRCALDPLKVAKTDRASWRLSEGAAVLSLPGLFLIKFENESGQSLVKRIDIPAISGQKIELHVK